EILVIRHVLSRIKNLISAAELAKIPVSRFWCTAAMARAMGLPPQLADAGAALRLKRQKDLAGHRVMLKLSQPRKPTKNNSSTRHQDENDYAKLYSYCIDDVGSEVELFLKLRPLAPQEQAYWEMDQRLNLRGFA